MKKRTIILMAVMIAIVGTAYKVVDDIITRLGMEGRSAQNSIISNLIGRFDSGPMEPGVEEGSATSVYAQSKSFRLPYAKMLSAVITGDKTGAASELCEYVKKYVNSEEFIADYQKAKEEAMPLVDKGMGMAELKRSANVCRINIKNYPNDTKYVAEQQGILDGYQKRIDAMLELSKKPFEGKAAWEKMYPADPALVVRKRLQEYIQLVATVDFAAKLTTTGRRQTFVNPVYEKKSLKWKAIFRAGKEVNDVVVAFVKEWLKGDIISDVKTKMTPDAPAKAASNASPANNNKTANNSGVTTTPAADTATTAAKEPPAEKKSGSNKIKQKIGSIFRN